MNRGERKPNILLIVTDQQRFDSLGCHGCRAISTPNVDRLAAEGVVFEQCYVNGTICTPSRASLMTGKHVPDHGVYGLTDALPAEERLFTERLRQHGYETALFGKLHVQSDGIEREGRHPYDGFDILELANAPYSHLNHPGHAYGRWLKAKDASFFERLLREKRKAGHIPEELHMTTWASERTCAYLEKERDKSKPFFCKMSLFDPHNPYFDYPPEFAGKVDPGELKPLRPPGDGRTYGAGYLQEQMIRGNADPEAQSDDVVPLRTGYYASIALIDQAVGRVLDALDKEQITRHTLVIFTSDHGDMLGDHGLFVKGPFFYDPCTRVPFLLRYPDKVAGGRRTDMLVQLHDMAATCLSAAGVPPDDIRHRMPDSVDLLDGLTQDGLTEDGKNAAAVRDEAVAVYRQSGTRKQEWMFERYAAMRYPGPSLPDSFRSPISAAMLRKGRYKLNVYYKETFWRMGVSGDDNALSGELFDMRSDPEEQHNLWDAPRTADVRKAMLARLADWMKQHADMK